MSDRGGGDTNFVLQNVTFPDAPNVRMRGDVVTTVMIATTTAMCFNVLRVNVRFVSHCFLMGMRVRLNRRRVWSRKNV